MTTQHSLSFNRTIVGTGYGPTILPTAPGTIISAELWVTSGASIAAGPTFAQVYLLDTGQLYEPFIAVQTGSVAPGVSVTMMSPFIARPHFDVGGLIWGGANVALYCDSLVNLSVINVHGTLVYRV